MPCVVPHKYCNSCLIIALISSTVVGGVLNRTFLKKPKKYIIVRVVGHSHSTFFRFQNQCFKKNVVHSGYLLKFLYNILCYYLYNFFSTTFSKKSTCVENHITEDQEKLMKVYPTCPKVKKKLSGPSIDKNSECLITVLNSP